MPTFKNPVQRASRATLEASARVGAFVDMYEIRMTSQDVKLRDWDNTPDLLRVSHMAKARRDIEKQRIIVEAFFNFEIAHDTDESRANPPALIRAVFSLIYSVTNVENISDQDTEAFGEANGIYNAWPFWRELVYSTLSRMGLPTVTLPTFRVIEGEPVEATVPNLSEAQPE